MKKLLAFVFTLFTVGCASQMSLRDLPENPAIPEVRVLLQKGTTASVSASTAFAIKEQASQKDILYVSAGQAVELKRAQDKVEVFDAQGKSWGSHDKVLFTSLQSDVSYSVSGNRYRGSLTAYVKDGALQLINVLSMERYLMGVVRNEIGDLSSDQLDAAKAQAIAARTYAVRYKNKYTDYDYVSDVQDQVYKGVSSESPITNQAVFETMGEILEYEGKPIQAFYYSTCGGLTANVQDVWRASPATPYLVSLSNKIQGHCLCEESPHYRWQINWTGAEIEQLVKKNLPLVFPEADTAKLNKQRLYNLAVLERDSSLRVKTFKIGFTKDEFTMTGEQARRVLRGDKYILYSSLFRIDLTRFPDGTIETAVCKGGGFGHGVGMCQYSARTMARQGYSYRQILQFFYRGAELRKSY